MSACAALPLWPAVTLILPPLDASGRLQEDPHDFSSVCVLMALGVSRPNGAPPGIPDFDVALAGQSAEVASIIVARPTSSSLDNLVSALCCRDRSESRFWPRRILAHRP